MESLQIKLQKCDTSGSCANIPQLSKLENQVQHRDNGDDEESRWNTLYNTLWLQKVKSAKNCVKSFHLINLLV